MNRIILAFTVADTISAEKLVEIVKNQVGFEIKDEDFNVEHIPMLSPDNVTLEEMQLLIGEPTPAEAIYAVLTAMANSKERIVVSKRGDNSAALAVAAGLIALNGWDEPREGWEKNIDFPQLNEDLDQRKKELTNTLFKVKKAETPAAGKGDEDTVPQPPVVTPVADETAAQPAPDSEVTGMIETPAPLVSEGTDATTVAEKAEGENEDDDPFAENK